MDWSEAGALERARQSDTQTHIDADRARRRAVNTYTEQNRDGDSHLLGKLVVNAVPDSSSSLALRFEAQAGKALELGRASTLLGSRLQRLN